MTVTTENSITTQVGNGVAVDFTFDFQTLDEAHIDAYEDDVLDAGVTVVLNADQDTSPGGTVTFPVAPANLAVVSIVRNMDYQQNTDYAVGGPFPSSSHETALDKNTMQVQQLEKEVSGAIKIPASEDPATYPMILPIASSRSNLFLAFDANGNLSLVASGSADPNAMQRPVLGPEDNIVLFSALKDGKNSGIAISDMARLSTAQTLLLKTLTSPKINEILDTNGNEIVDFPTIASAVNFLRLVASATGNTLQIQAQGDDANIDLALVPKGTGNVLLDALKAIATDGDLNLVRNGAGNITIDSVPIYGFVSLDEPELLVTNSSTTTVNWTTFDMSAGGTEASAAAAAGATKAILKLKSTISSSLTTSAGNMWKYVYLGKSGYSGAPSGVTEAQYLQEVKESTGLSIAANTTIDTVMVNLDSNSDFQYGINFGSGITINSSSTSIYLVGYYT